MENQMDSKRFKAIGANASVDVICKRRTDGEIAICPQCETDLVFAFTWDVANKYNRHPGIFCPTDSRHYQVWFNIAEKPTTGTNGHAD